MKKQITNYYLPITVICYWLSVISLLFICSCNIFETRDPEPPSQSRSHFITPTTDSLVIENLKFAIEEKNTENYLKCLSDSSQTGTDFIFTPSPEAQNQHESIFREWSLLTEKNYFERLRLSAVKNSPSALLLRNERRTYYNDSVIVAADYTLTFVHSKKFPHEARGYFEMTLGKDQSRGTWSIYRWSDFKYERDTSLTWSDWKAFFSK